MNFEIQDLMCQALAVSIKSYHTISLNVIAQMKTEIILTTEPDSLNRKTALERLNAKAESVLHTIKQQNALLKTAYGQLILDGDVQAFCDSSRAAISNGQMDECGDIDSFFRSVFRIEH